MVRLLSRLRIQQPSGRPIPVGPADGSRRGGIAPCLAAASPSLMGLDQFGDLERLVDLQANFQQVEYLRGGPYAIAKTAGFLGLLLPRVLMRLPYDDGGAPAISAFDSPKTFVDRILIGTCGVARSMRLARCSVVPWSRAAGLPICTARNAASRRAGS